MTPIFTLDYELISAARSGDADEVEELPLHGADPMDQGSRALVWAANNGHVDCVAILMPVSDPQATDAQALWSAAIDGYASCVETLLSASIVAHTLEAARSKLEDYKASPSHHGHIAFMIEARIEALTLSASIPQTRATARKAAL